MNRLFYPAVFHKAEEGGFWVSFPDLPECMTQGDSMDEAYEMAVDALGLSLSCMEDEGTAFPKASELDTVDSEDGVLVIVEFDMAEYRRKNRSKAVKKTLSIPEWLNEAAIRENLNFSQILQEALMVKLGNNKQNKSF
ncbi:type II toxin-antitoxin system HicB family antitoxin [[Ruminococcus] lactaris]|uniref:type II toxin-antitoxin system HicB family antitoxin n=1 Tax=[Ruminococcus] lactaris TaxID=46228 RepID=UPI0023B1C615|nr:type II toxin-antitoxin system HicB family antitoxin [[Ruminococcus] lactaris]MDE8699277.1 type II toxin-antitoxin system HicB family antitoxin [[Ruminococcus] lactaris]